MRIVTIVEDNPITSVRVMARSKFHNITTTPKDASTDASDFTEIYAICL